MGENSRAPRVLEFPLFGNFGTIGSSGRTKIINIQLHTLEFAVLYCGFGGAFDVE